MSGKFIVLEGLDGCGKTTQGNILKSHLEEWGYDVIFKREPGGTTVSERLREIILDRDITDMHPLTEMYLYAASRCQLVHKVIIPGIEAGKVVVLDRFLLSSIAYQGYGRQLGRETVEEVNRLAVDKVKPDLTILFDMRRREDRLEGTRDRMELSSGEFFNRVYEGYMAAYDKSSTLIIDAQKSIDEISKEILGKVGEILK